MTDHSATVFATGRGVFWRSAIFISKIWLFMLVFVLVMNFWKVILVWGLCLAAIVVWARRRR